MTHPDQERRPRLRLRLNKLTDWRMQLRLVGWFLAAGTFALGLQYILTVNRLTVIAMDHAVDPGPAFESARAMTQRVLLVSMGVTLPLTTIIGILATSRLAGPIHRLTGFLEATRRDEAPPDCRLRQGDELQHLCELINETTRTVRERPAQARPSDGSTTASNGQQAA